jgi:hypothetical protein
MKKSKDQTDWIDSYLCGQLEDAALAEFEHRMYFDPAFKQEVEAQKAVREILAEIGTRSKSTAAVAASVSPEKLLPQSPLPESDPLEHTVWKRPDLIAVIASLALLLINGIVIWNHRPIDPAKRRPAPAPASVLIQTFNVPVVEENVPALSRNTSPETLVVAIISDAQYSNHYSFKKDTLRIFTREGIYRKPAVMYDPHTRLYKLFLNGRQYLLTGKKDNITELLAE